MGEGDSEAAFFNVLGSDREGIEQSSARSQALHLLAEEGFGKSIIINALQPKGPAGEQTPNPNAFILASKITPIGHVVLCENGRIVAVAMSEGFTKDPVKAKAYIDTFAASPFVAYPHPMEPGSEVTSLDDLIQQYEQEGWVEHDSRQIGIQAFKPIIKDAIAVSGALRHRPPVIQARVYREVYGAFFRDKKGGILHPPGEDPSGT